jgi:hypothetical protein
MKQLEVENGQKHDVAIVVLKTLTETLTELNNKLFLLTILIKMLFYRSVKQFLFSKIEFLKVFLYK